MLLAVCLTGGFLLTLSSMMHHPLWLQPGRRSQNPDPSLWIKTPWVVGLWSSATVQL
jgi:hypothetical protein